MDLLSIVSAQMNLYLLRPRQLKSSFFSYYLYLIIIDYKFRALRHLLVTLFGNRTIKLRSQYFPHLISKLGWRLPGFLFKDIGKIGVLVVPQFKRYFRNGLVGGDQQVFGLY